MKLRLYQVDAFASEIFRGNPAAVCLLEEWLPDALLQAIAEENNLSETAFLVPSYDPIPLRWFTPTAEVPLCGHATLASAFVLFERLFPTRDTVEFTSLSGPLHAYRSEDGVSLDLPALIAEMTEPPTLLRAGLDVEFRDVRVTHTDPNYYVIVETQADLVDLRPRLTDLEGLHPYAVAVSAPGESVDFVSRYFAPGYGIPEDPVTGSIHCALGPYWADRLEKSSLEARQLSRRGGALSVLVARDRVRLGGPAVCYLDGWIEVPDVLH